ncbi:hypothetical protein KQI63_13860 [bacterium]|nr:hypothetical protein [bacterium]
MRRLRVILPVIVVLAFSMSSLAGEEIPIPPAGWNSGQITRTTDWYNYGYVPTPNYGATTTVVYKTSTSVSLTAQDPDDITVDGINEHATCNFWITEYIFARSRIDENTDIRSSNTTSDVAIQNGHGSDGYLEYEMQSRSGSSISGKVIASSTFQGWINPETVPVD